MAIDILRITVLSSFDDEQLEQVSDFSYCVIGFRSYFQVVDVNAISKID